MLEGATLGVIQGIAEWLPVSSEGMIALVETNFFGKSDVGGIVRLALFLHLGTFLAALIYLRREVKAILISLIRYRSSTPEERSILHFLIISTIFSGLLGITLLKGLEQFESQIEFSGRTLTALIGILLLVTAWLQLKKKDFGTRMAGDLNSKDSILLGLAQGLAVLPGLSRSGLTVSVLLLRKVDDENALKLSFLLSLPIVLAGNIILNLEMFTSISSAALWGLVLSFIFGLATIHILIKLARKINFGYFVGIFGFLMIGASLV